MKKLIVAIAIMAFVPAAFGAVSLQLLNSDGTNTHGPLTAGQSITVNVVADPGSATVTGFSYALSADVAGLLKITNRTIDSTVLTDATTALGTVLNSANCVLNPKSGKDLGAGSSDGMTGMAGKETIQTLTLTAIQDISGNPKLNIYVVGAGTADKATWADPDFNTTELDKAVYTITPEPASMVLLAAAGAFFARRRRA